MSPYPPQFCYDKPIPELKEVSIEIFDDDSKVIGEVDIEIFIDNETYVTAWYKGREIVHLKESFFEQIYDESGVIIGRMEHGFITE